MVGRPKGNRRQEGASQPLAWLYEPCLFEPFCQGATWSMAGD